MAERVYVPDADRQEQLDPAGEQAVSDPLDQLKVGVNAPEADLLEQQTPAGPQPESLQLPSGPLRAWAVPEADALEQALPADHELFEDED